MRKQGDGIYTRKEVFMSTDALRAWAADLWADRFYLEAGTYAADARQGRGMWEFVWSVIGDSPDLPDKARRLLKPGWNRRLEQGKTETVKVCLY
jgi:hypothetical protein